jgi:hypothetical protein
MAERHARDQNEIRTNESAARPSQSNEPRYGHDENRFP